MRKRTILQYQYDNSCILLDIGGENSFFTACILAGIIVNLRAAFIDPGYLAVSNQERA